MKIRVYYCERCERQIILSEHCSGTVYCNGCHKCTDGEGLCNFTEFPYFETEVEMPKPHIEKGTYVKVRYGGDKSHLEFVQKFQYFTKEGYVKTNNGTWKHYELITPDEIDPNFKKCGEK